MTLIMGTVSLAQVGIRRKMLCCTVSRALQQVWPMAVMECRFCQRTAPREMKLLAVEQCPYLAAGCIVHSQHAERECLCG